MSAQAIRNVAVCQLLGRRSHVLSECARLTQNLLLLSSVLALASCGESRLVNDLQLDLSCASGHGLPELTVLARLRARGSLLKADAEITLVNAEHKFVFTVPAGAAQARVTFPKSLAAGTSLTGTATSTTGSEMRELAAGRGSCIVENGLADVSPAARAVPGGAVVKWPDVQGAVSYRLAALDFTADEVLAELTTESSSETLLFDAPSDHVVMIDFVADALPDIERPMPLELPVPRRLHRQILLTSGTTGGSAEPWQLFGPGDFVGGTLEVRYPGLASGERVAVILVNGGGSDLGSSDEPAAWIEVQGTSEPEPSEKHGGKPVAGHDPLPRVVGDPPFLEHRPLESIWRAPRAMQREPSSTQAPEVGDEKTFCVTDWAHETSHQFRRISARLEHRSEHAAFWVDGRAREAFEAALDKDVPDFWQQLEKIYERRILPALRSHFGPESDVNGDGLTALLFTDLGPQTETGMLGGFFDYRDVYYPVDTTDDCNSEEGNRGSNGQDLLYLRDLASFGAVAGPIFSPEYVLNNLYPNLIAHELQHDINFHQRFLQPTRVEGGISEESWLNEALSQVAEDVAGYGLNLATERARAAAYLRNYAKFSLTSWQGFSDGNYGGVHVFLRYFMDRFGPELTQRLQNAQLSGKANFGKATGIPFDLALAHFATASLFSNEPSSPSVLFDYKGQSWTPWHSAIGPAAYTPFSPNSPAAVETLRGDGWHALVSSSGQNQPVSIRVQTGAARAFYVVTVKFSGNLP